VIFTSGSFEQDRRVFERIMPMVAKPNSNAIEANTIFLFTKGSEFVYAKWADGPSFAPRKGWGG
jgi:hypothetical protein